MSTINERDWAAKTAMRLRIVQATKVESDSPDRGREVWEFISLAMKELDSVDADQRRKCMRALDEEFPFFESRPSLGGEKEALVGSAPAGRAESVPASPDELVQQLIAASAAISGDEREKHARRLTEAGFQVEQTTVRDVPGGLKAALALPVYEEEHVRLKRTVDRILEKLTIDLTKGGSRAELNLTRCLQMLGLMSEQYLHLHPQVWALWDHLASSQQYTTSFNRPTLPASQALAEFLQGKAGARRADLGEMVTKTYYLLNALITAVTEAGNEFALWFFQKFGPENIQSVLDFETNASKAGPAEYWKRYCELTQHENETEMKEQFQKLLGKAMLRHLQRRPTSA